MYKKEVIATDKAPKAIGPYSQAVKVGSWLFVSGQIPVDPATGEIVTGGIEKQTERVMENINNILIFSGMGLQDVIKTTIYLQNINEFAKFNETYAKFFPLEPPARATVEVSRLPKSVGIEIETIAYKE
ncbi:MAG: hypothetical protein A2042_07695 [Candidatus Schekmanbacteria bacterium GWA2_38_11]|uniref:Reactive intermediate/imine deaminase n=2 Tax=Candidatus Schekmaniibacteriota TaxID=1817811 RepID=A0A1F7RDG1_9BACT|nr:MAG: hypothetical protein A2042_07695 [Candidatus Schekmanbacteria bacterium GWA2_38_11]